MMRLALVSAAALLIAGCATAPKPPKGGTAWQDLSRQQMTQPDAPEGMSRLVWHERVTEHRPEGVLVVTERIQETELGGAQDWAAIVREYARADLLKGLFVALALAVVGIVAWSTGWPIVAAILGGGAFASVAFAWWAGPLAAAAGLIAKLAYTQGALDRITRRR